jgi:hypothetical protein
MQQQNFSKNQDVLITGIPYHELSFNAPNGMENQTCACTYWDIMEPTQHG